MGDRLSNEEVVRRYAAGSAAADLEKLAELRHRNWSAAPDWRAPWVEQTGDPSPNVFPP